jgi:thiamine biosynthesis protein ThiS
MTYSPARDQNSAVGTENAAVTLTVNGERMTASAGTSVADFLRVRALDPRLVVVEHNRVILRDRDAYGGIKLRDGDTLEIVHFVGGG